GEADDEVSVDFLQRAALQKPIGHARTRPGVKDRSIGCGPRRYARILNEEANARRSEAIVARVVVQGKAQLQRTAWIHAAIDINVRKVVRGPDGLGGCLRCDVAADVDALH